MTFELAGLDTVTRTARLLAAQDTSLDTDMVVSKASESVETG